MMHNVRMLFATTLLVTTSYAYAFEVLPDKVPVPADNPMTPEKIALGKQLYFDTRLSLDNTVSCNTCHDVTSALGSGTDNHQVSTGVQNNHGTRNAPTVLNAAFLSVQFWDGRAVTLEDQAKKPILNPVEMALPSEEEAVNRIKAVPGYVVQFNQVFGGANPITYDNIVRAIAAYERTLITPNAPFDRYLKGDKNVVSEQAIRGSELVEEIGCTGCHTGPDYAGPELPVGQGFYQRFPTYTDNEYVAKYKLLDDLGRYNTTKNPADKYMFRVQTWRNVALTAPYFNNGSVNTLPEAVRVMARTQLDKTLTDDQVTDIVAFLTSLTGEFQKQTPPRLP